MGFEQHYLDRIQTFLIKNVNFAIEDFKCVILAYDKFMSPSDEDQCILK